MKDQIIVVFDLKRGDMNVYRDIGPVAEMMGIKRTTLRSRLEKSVQYDSGVFVGLATIHKSRRGGKR